MSSSLPVSQRTVISPVHSGMCTEIGDMPEEEALEVLRKASGAHGPLPAEGACKVRIQATIAATTWISLAFGNLNIRVPACVGRPDGLVGTHGTPSKFQVMGSSPGD